jgi:prepilin signal peptidase PulO-like enzyme (type II secretory pathway)
MSALPLAALGFLIGFPLARIVASYADGGVVRTGSPWNTRSAQGAAIPVVLAALFGVVGSGVGVGHTGSAAHLAVTLCEVTVLVAVMFVDLRARLVPTDLVATLVALAFADAAFWSGLGVGRAAIGGAVGFAIFLALIALARLVFGDGALGLGDATLALAIGCVTGYPLVAFTLCMGVLFGALGAAVILLGSVVLRRADVGLHTTIPYAPFLMVGVFYVLAGLRFPF